MNTRRLNDPRQVEEPSDLSAGDVVFFSSKYLRGFAVTVAECSHHEHRSRIRFAGNGRCFLFETSPSQNTFIDLVTGEEYDVACSDIYITKTPRR